MNRKTKDDISVVILFFHINKHTKSHQAIDQEIIETSRCYSDGDDDAKEVLPSISPDTPSYRHSLSEINLSLHATRQSCRDPLSIVFNRGKDETRVSIGRSASKEL